jgi:hypothetical protein
MRIALPILTAFALAAPLAGAGPETQKESGMEIIRNGSQSFSKGSADYFTGNVRIATIRPAWLEAWSISSRVRAPTGTPIRWARP